jgi:hypothetical protein
MRRMFVAAGTSANGGSPGYADPGRFKPGGTVHRIAP